MWILVPEPGCSQGEERYSLLVDQEYNVGRKEPCQIVIPSDVSISRKHALLTVTLPDNQVSHPEKPPVLTIKDLSKFGTFINDKNLSGQQATIKKGDLVRFGTSGLSVYRAVYEPFIITTSCLETASKKTVKQATKQLGGHVVSDWRKECSTVVMSNLSVTIKVICALVSQKPIVTPTYLEDLLKAVRAKTKHPDPLEYLPPLAESQIDPKEVSFKPTKNRSTIFQGKLFIFLTSKQFKKLSLAIELGGGIPMLVEEGTDDNVNEDIIIQPGTCVMNFDPSLDQSQSLSKHALEWINRVMKLLKEHNRRPIPESEIGFAVLYFSTVTYCNPEVEPTAPRASAVLPPPSLSQMEPPGGDTERQSGDSLSRHVVKTEQSAVKVKNEPFSQKTADRLSSKKRAREDDEDQPTVQKTPRIHQVQDTAVKPEPLTPRTSTAMKQGVATPGGSGRHMVKMQVTAFSGAGKSSIASSGRDKRRREDSDSDSIQLEEPSEPNIVNLDSDEDCFDSVPTKGRGRRTTRDATSSDTTSSKRAKHSSHTTDSVSVKLSPVRPVEEERGVSPLRGSRRHLQADTEPKTEMVDTAVSRQRGSRRFQADTEPKTETEDEFNVVPTRGQRNKARSQVKTETVSKVKTPTDSDEDSFGAVSNNNKDGVRSHDQTHSKHGSRGNHGVGSDDGGGYDLKPGQTIRSRDSTQTSTLPDRPIKAQRREYSSSGTVWLSCKSGNQAPVEKITTREDDMPVGLVVTETAQLVARQKERNYEICEWEGQNVKNFKRFKKGGVVTFGLRDIIGGTDLEPYISDRKASHEWLKDQKTAEKEREDYERMAESFFDQTEKLDNRKAQGTGQRSGRAINGGRRR